MKVQKTIQCGVVNLTNVKKELLEQEYSNLQKFLQGQEHDKLHSANKQQAKRYYTKIKKDKEYPISIRKDLISIRECNSNIADYFVKIPVAGRYGGVKVPIKTHIAFPEEFEFCESKLYKKDNRFFIN